MGGPILHKLMLLMANAVGVRPTCCSQGVIYGGVAPDYCVAVVTCGL